MSTFADLPELLRLHICWVNASQLAQINLHFGGLKSAFQQEQSVWQNSGILSSKQLDNLFSSEINQLVDESMAWGEIAEQGWLSWSDEGFPNQLKQIDDPPILLGYRGDKALLNDPQIAIVGSRHASKSGVAIAEDFAEFLSQQGLTITSGLALGIDAAAHRGGLRGIGKTVAVVATGLDRIYPASNKRLGQEVVEQGVMISEFALGAKPISYHFPKRNRIISGLSYGTLVVEAALKSGSLITAHIAMEQGKEVFAVPGSIHNPQAKGCHQLIKQGAKLVESGEDILQELAGNLTVALSQKSNSLTSPVDNPSVDLFANKDVEVSQPALMQYLDFEPVSLDELVVLSKLPVSSIQSELMLLELAGEIEALSGARWRRIK